MEPDIVLLDEPLGALDALTRRELQELIRDLHTAESKTFVIVTHDVEEALAVADRLIVLGHPGTGILYDSATTDERLNREGLIRLLQGTRVVFAAGTWGGYLPVHKAAIEHKTQVYDLWLGMSDQERLEALRSGRTAGAFLTLPSLATWQEAVRDLDLVTVHVFSRPASQDVVERILLNPRARQDSKLRWAVPGGGLETALIPKIDPAVASERVIEMKDRAACVLAVANGEVDACVADYQFARSLLTLKQRLLIKWQPLPEKLWRDLWTVLVVSRRTLLEQREALAVAVQRLAFDAGLAAKQLAGKIDYPNRVTSLAALRDGTITKAFASWGGKNLSVATDLLETDLTLPRLPISEKKI
jgi:energy-coupling factor transporter ATP-binding protein EcfA2